MLIFGLWIASLSARADLPRDCATYERYRCEGGNTYPVHLTFDDGPAESLTDQVLETLKREKVQATFFVMGEKLDSSSPQYRPAYAPLIRRMLSEGHRVGSHSYRHLMHTQYTDAQIRDFIHRAKWAGREELGTYLSPLFRLPWGDGWYNEKQKPEKSRKIMKALADEGFIHVGWDVVSWDWDAPRQRSPGILDIVLRRICSAGGGVVLMHDIQPNTVKHLDEWIQAVKCLGHELVPLDRFVKPVEQGARAESRTTCPGKGDPSHPEPRVQGLAAQCGEALKTLEFRPW